MKPSSSQLFLLAIILLFLMLWLPIGNREFVHLHWMKLGSFGGLFMLFGVFAFSNGSLIKNLKFLAVIMLLAYIVHQFEEHWIDLYGQRFSFYYFTNNIILERLDAADSLIWPLTKKSIYFINTALVWLIGLLAIWRSPKHLFPFFAMASIILVNGLVHTIMAVATWNYNPGLLTSILVFIPLFFWIIRPFRQTYRTQIMLSLVWAVVAHIILIAGLLAANWYHYIAEDTYFLIMIVWSILPCFVFKNDGTELEHKIEN